MAAQEDPRVGSFIGGKWRVDALLGTGSMASVYAVTHRNGSRAALKILHDNLASDVAVCERFLGEGYLTNSIKHSGIVRVFDDGMTDDGAPFLAMDLLEGETLDVRRTKAGGKLAMFDVIDIADKIMDTLSAVHVAGIIHRDLKPQNVFCEQDGGIRLLDFGVARLQERVTAHSIVGMVLGTPSFMAPEQALGGKDVDARSDIWALGAIMFTLLTGETVHVATTVQARLLAAASVRARSIATLAPHLPPDVTLVVDTALQFKKDDRWQTVQAMRNALQNVKQSLPPPNLVDAAFDSIRQVTVPPAQAAQRSAPPPPTPQMQRQQQAPTQPQQQHQQQSAAQHQAQNAPHVPPAGSSKTMVGMNSPSGTFTSAPPLAQVTNPAEKKLQTQLGVGPLGQGGSRAPLPPGVPIPPGMAGQQQQYQQQQQQQHHAQQQQQQANAQSNASNVPAAPNTKRGVGNDQVRPPQPSSPSQPAPPLAPPEKQDPHRVPYESLISAQESAGVPAVGNTYPAWAQSANAEDSAEQSRKRRFKIAVSLAAMVAAALVAFAAVAFIKQGTDNKGPKPTHSLNGSSSGAAPGSPSTDIMPFNAYAGFDAGRYTYTPPSNVQVNNGQPHQPQVPQQPQQPFIPGPPPIVNANAKDAGVAAPPPQNGGAPPTDQDASTIELW